MNCIQTSIVTYYWTPTSLMGKPEVDLVRLTEPAYDKACWDEMMVVVEDIKANGPDVYEPSCACEYKDMSLTKLATGKGGVYTSPGGSKNTLPPGPTIIGIVKVAPLCSPKIVKLVSF